MTRRCYLVLVATEREKRGLVRALLPLSAVLRITDHGPHIKIISSQPLDDRLRRRKLRFVSVPDRTKHWDVRYWDFTMQIARHALQRRQKPSVAFSVMVHYLCNIWGLHEVEVLAWVIAGRARVDRTVSDEQAHGWELRALQRLNALPKRRV